MLRGAIAAGLLGFVVAGTGPGAFADSAKTVSGNDYLHRSAQAGTLRGNEVVFSGRRITVPVVAVAPGAPDATFEVHGQVNPTLVIPAGAKVRFELANVDKGMPHGLDVTIEGPPYAANPDLPLHKTPGKRSANAPAAMGRHPVVSLGVAPKNGNGPLVVKQSAWFTLKPGQYYYVCPVPGHASAGMHGRIVVEKGQR